MRRIGATLLEIITVMTILLVIAAVIFPVFTRSKERAKEAVCVSNIRQLLASIEIYANDHDGNNPWLSPSSPDYIKYVGGVGLYCPVPVPGSGRRSEYINVSSRPPDLPEFKFPDPDYPKKYDACKELRQGAFPYILDVNHVSKLQRANTGRSAAIVGRANGSIVSVVDPIAKLTGEESALPCDPSLFWLNL